MTADTLAAALLGVPCAGAAIVVLALCALAPVILVGWMTTVPDQAGVSG